MHALHPLPLGAIRPTGWLLRQLELQATGLTGHAEDIWPDVGPTSGWLGGPGESWERGPYYLDGLVPLAYLLDDDTLREKADRWIAWMFESQRPDGWFGPADNDDWWPRMVALKVITQYAEATQDPRAEQFLARYFEYQLRHLPARPVSSWGAVRAMDNALSVLWLHRRDPQDRWLDLVDILLAQNVDWVHYLTTDLITGKAQVFDHRTHGPNVAMGLKLPAVRALLDRARGRADVTRRHLADLERCLAELDRWHGQVHGVFSGDEWLAGREASQGVETCHVMELMFSMEQSAFAFGAAWCGDAVENLAFNLLPASCDARMRSHQYHQQATQIAATVDDRDWSYSTDAANTFGLEPHFGCCMANLHQGWPKFVAALWGASPDRRELTAIAYAPNTLRTTVDGTPVVIATETDYPFREEITLRVDPQEPLDFAVRLRRPDWCETPLLRVNGAVTDVIDDAGYMVVDRRWEAGDVVELVLPMRPRRVRRERNAVGVRLGPLLMVAGLTENWREIPGGRGLGEWEVTRGSSWNVGLVAHAGGGIEHWPVTRSDVGEVPFDRASAPVAVTAPVARVRSWGERHGSALPVPDSPIPVGSPVHDMDLVPYGSARLRVAEFPVVLPQADETPWE